MLLGELKHRLSTIKENPFPLYYSKEIRNDHVSFKTYIKPITMIVWSSDNTPRYYNQKIFMPDFNLFQCEEYLQTCLFHEYAHATGSIKHLKRKVIVNCDENTKNFGYEDYAEEEIIAELTSMMLMSYFKLETEDTIKNSLMYIKLYAKYIRSELWLLWTKAQEAKQYLITEYKK